jgi:hypothetical protein
VHGYVRKDGCVTCRERDAARVRNRRLKIRMEDQLSGRIWDVHLEHEVGRHTRHYRIVCSTCRTVGDSGAQAFGAETAAQVIPKKFRAMGWEVGKKPSQDMCPICVDVMKFERNQKEQTMKTQTVKTQTPERHTVVTGIDTVRTVQVPQLQVVDNSPPRAEPPREMSRDDRRIIFAKIGGHGARPRRDHRRQGDEPNRSTRKSRKTLTFGKRWRPGA